MKCFSLSFAPRSPWKNISSPGQWLAEFVATFGLLLTILGCLARTPAAIPYAGGILVHGIYLFCQPSRDDSARAI
jgi:glycerol uptake facilitator-like aquaporin